MSKKGGLGRGLDALFEISNSDANVESSVTLPISDLVPNKNQPRKEFSEEALAELSDSIIRHGILQPILVKPLPDATYKIIAGERRYRAAMLAGLTEVPVIIKEISDRELAEIALIENLQREDLNPVEEAMGFRLLQEEYSLTQEEIASTVGKSRPAVANSLRLLSLPQEVIDMLGDGRLTGGHARALLSMENETQIVEAAKRIAESGASVREAERMAKERQGMKKSAPRVLPVESFFKETEIALTQTLGKKVTVGGSSKKGTLSVEFYSREELTELAGLLSGEKLGN